MVTQRKKFVKNWLLGCTVIGATITTLIAINGGYMWKAKNDAGNERRDTEITDTKGDIKQISAKLDEVRSNTSEIRGMVKTLVELTKEKLVAGQ